MSFFRPVETIRKGNIMPANNGYFRRKGRKEDALKRRLTNIEAYQGDENVTTKLKIAEAEVVNLRHNISLSQRGRW